MGDFLSQIPPDTIEGAQFNETGGRRPSELMVKKFALQQETGIHPDQMPDDEGAIEYSRSLVANQRYNWDRLASESPRTAAWLEARPEHIDMLGSDVPFFGHISNLFGSMKESFERGSMTVELSEIVDRIRANEATDADRRRREEINKELGIRETLGLNYKMDGLLTGIPGAVFNQLPILGYTTFGGLKGAAVGAVAGGIAGFAGLGAGAAPGAVAGAGYGFVFGTFAAGTRLESNLLWDQLQNAVDANGNRLSKGDIEEYAFWGGLIAGSFELLGLTGMGKALAAPLKSVSARMVRGGLADGLRQAGARSVVAQSVKALAVASLAEGSTEAAQEITGMVTEDLAKAHNEGRQLDVGDVMVGIYNDPDRMSQIKQAAKVGAQAAFGLGLFGNVITYRSRAQKAEVTQVYEHTMREVSAQLSATGLSKIDGYTHIVEDFAKSAVKDHGSESFYIPAGELESHAESLGVSHAELLAAFSPEERIERAAHGQMLQVPVEKALALGFGDPVHSEFFIMNTSLDPSLPTVKEAKSIVDENAKAIAEQTGILNFDPERTPDAALPVIEQVRSRAAIQLKNLGWNERDANAAAHIVRARIASDAARGVDVVKNQNIYDVTFKSASPSELQKLAESVGQGGKISERGNALIQPNGDMIVALTPHSDPTTFIHEMGHVFNGQMSRLMEIGEAPQSMVDDYNSIMKSIGVKKNTPMAKIPYKKREAFARRFESYMRTGKAPSKELRGVFRRFASWMARVWPGIRSLGRVNDKVRSAFDRLLAVDSAIAETLASNSIDVNLLDSESIQIPESMSQRYNDAKELAMEEMSRPLRETAQEQILVESSAEWSARREELVPAYRSQLLERPEYALGELLSGRPVDGAVPFKLDLTDETSDLARSKPDMVERGGQDPALIAGLYGFNNVTDMSATLSSIRGVSEEAAFLADTQIREEIGDLQDNLDMDSVSAIASDAMGNLLKVSLDILNSKELAEANNVDRVSRPAYSDDVIERVANERLSGVPIGMINPASELRALGDSSRRAAEARESGDLSSMADEIRNQIVIHRMLQKSVAVIDKVRSDLKSIDEYQLSDEASEDAESLSSRMDTSDVSGMTPEELSGVANEARAMMGSDNAERKTAESALSIESEIVSSIQSVRDSEWKPTSSLGKLTKKYTKKLLENGFFMSLNGMEFMARDLDGGKANGVFSRNTYGLVAKGFNEDARMNREHGGVLAKILSELPGKYRRSLGEKVSVKGVSVEGGMTRMFTINVAIMSSDPASISALQDAYGLSNANVSDIISSLSENDLKLAQGIVDVFDSMWGDYSKSYTSLNGFSPTRDDSHGPLERSGAISEIVDLGGADAVGLDWVGPAIRDSIRGIALDEPIMVVQKVLKSKRVREQISSYLGPKALDQMDHWIKNVSGNIQLPSTPFHEVLRKVRGGATIAYLGAKISTIIAQPLGAFLSVEEIGEGNYARGLKYFIRAVSDLVGPGMMDKIREMDEMSAELRNRSSNLDRDLKSLFDMSVSPGVTGQITETRARATQLAFMGISFGDKLVSYPTWKAALMRANDGDVEGILGVSDPGGMTEEAIAARREFADGAVRRSQGSGSTKDLAKLTSSDEVMKLFTMFYHFWGTHVRQMQKTGRRFAQSGSIMQVLGAILVMNIAPAILESVFLGRSPELDDDGEDWAKWAFIKSISYPMNGIPFIRDGVYMFEQKAFRYAGVKSNQVVKGGPRLFDYNASPVFRGVESMIRSASSLGDWVADDRELTRADKRNLLESFGVAIGFPSSQLWITGEAVYDTLFTDDYKPSGPLDAVGRFALGRKQQQ